MSQIIWPMKGMNSGVALVMLSTVAQRTGWFWVLLNARDDDGITPLMPHEYSLTNFCTYCMKNSSSRAMADLNGVCAHAKVRSPSGTPRDLLAHASHRHASRDG